MSTDGIKVIDQVESEVDGFPFTVVTFESETSYFILSYLRKMPVSHKYEIEFDSFPKGSDIAIENLDRMRDLALRDLSDGLYKRWIINWASQ